MTIDFNAAFGIASNDIVVKPVLKVNASITDFEFLVDDSGSMGSYTNSKQFSSKVTRKYSVKANAAAIFEAVSEVDTDGVGLWIFSTYVRKIEDATPYKLAEFFNSSPNGSTNLSGALKKVFAEYLEKRAKKQTKQFTYLVVITDGEPDDEQSVFDELISFSHKLNCQEEYQIAFFQAGNDSGAKLFLNKMGDGLIPVDHPTADFNQQPKGMFGSIFGNKSNVNTFTPIRSSNGQYSKFDLVTTFDCDKIESEANLAQTIANGAFG